MTTYQELLKQRMAINAKIRSLRVIKINRYIAILTEYYINCQRWEDIAESMEMSVRHTLRLHGEAVQAFRKKFDFS